MREPVLTAIPEPTPYHKTDERDQVAGRHACTVSCVRCPRCKSLLHVGNIVQRRYRAKLVKAGRCVVCTRANPDRRFRVCPKCRADSRARAKKWYLKQQRSRNGLSN